ncbi:hypothetical protein C8T65DRAFT_639765 [Cerioporus squamosus]|nr:hypothetical protein C8T65DRAFT_639765 [Cerioporus squamosus]
MYFAIAAVALAALSQVAQATPLSTVATKVEAFRQAVTIASKFPVHDLRVGSVAAQPNVTLPSDSLRSDVAGGAGAILLLCPATNCLSCFAFDLGSLPDAEANECLIDESSTFVSAAISQASNAGLPFEVLVGPSGCLSFAQIPAVNQCFNLSPAPFADFAILT